MLNVLSEESSMSPHQYCKLALPKVSRTFAISISVLRGDFYKSILCSYLLCRILDTFEDSSFKDFLDQEFLFKSFKQMFELENYSDRSIKNGINSFFANAVLKKEEVDYYNLVKNTDVVIANFLTLPDNYRAVIRECILEMSAGMLSMLSKRECCNNPFFLQTEADLEKYCYYVAGTVGVLSTKLLREHSRSINGTLFSYLNDKAISLGLGLQMTNILKDCWADYQKGVCYIPIEMVSKYGLKAENFFESNSRERAQLTLNELISKAVNHLDNGLDLILSIPRFEYRVKLSCLWPLFFAITTLIEIKRNTKLLSGDKIKISRAKVKRLMRLTTIFGWNNISISRYYESFRKML